MKKMSISETSDIQITGNITILDKFSRNVPALSCGVLPNSDILALGWSDGVIEVRNAKSYEVIHSIKEHSLPVTFLSAYTNDSKDILLASHTSGDTVMWNVKEKQKVWTMQGDCPSLTNDINSNYTCCAVGGSNGKIRIYDVECQKTTQILQGSIDPDIMDAHTSRVFAVRFHPSRSNELVSGGWDGTVQFWDIREPFSRRKIRGPNICGDGIDFINENTIITASWSKRNNLQVWDYSSGTLIQTIKPDNLPCFTYFCHYIQADDPLLLTGGSDKNMLRVIDGSTFRSLATIQNLEGAVYFAKELPKSEPFSFNLTMCFCSNSTIYIAEVQS